MARILGLILCLTVLVQLWAQDPSVEEEQKITKAAKNPYSLGRYLDSHPDTDWTLLWKVLDIEAGPPFYCDSTDRCLSVEVITAFNPEQVILIVKHHRSEVDVYLRYRPEKGGAWHLAGTYMAMAKYMSTEHRLDGPREFRIWSSPSYRLLLGPSRRLRSLQYRRNLTMYGSPPPTGVRTQV